VLRWGRIAARCPVAALQDWHIAAVITGAPVFRALSAGNPPGTRPMNPASVNALVHGAAGRAGLDPASYSAHSLRAGFVTYAKPNPSRSPAPADVDELAPHWPRLAVLDGATNRQAVLRPTSTMLQAPSRHPGNAVSSPVPSASVISHKSKALHPRLA